MKRYLTEFIGTFFLVMTIGFTGNPVAIGAALAALVYMGGYISGAHYNPAVTTALWLNNKISKKVALGYMGVQILGAFCAAIVYFLIKGSTFVPGPAVGTTAFAAIVVEAIFTFLLVSVVLHVAATEKTKGNDYYGLAIGLALMVGAFVGGPISGGAYNPAVGIGPILFDITHIQTHFANLLFYIIGPMFGAALAAEVYKLK